MMPRPRPNFIFAVAVAFVLSTGGCSWFLYGDYGSREMVEYSSYERRVERLRLDPLDVTRDVDLGILLDSYLPPFEGGPAANAKTERTREIADAVRVMTEAVRTAPATGRPRERSYVERPPSARQTLDRHDLPWIYTLIGGGVRQLRRGMGPDLARLLSDAARPPESDAEASGWWEQRVGKELR